VKQITQRDKLRALEYVDDVISTYRGHAAVLSREFRESMPYEERADLDNRIGGVSATIERLEHVRLVVADSLRRKKRPRTHP
jgi:hypothetical protein